MPVKQDILESIAAMARQLGRAPSLSEFLALAGISEYFVMQCFPSWNDAVRAAGLDPNISNVRIEDCELLRDWGETVRKNRAIPSRRTYQREGQYDIRTIERRFGPWSSIPETFRKFAQDKPEWADLAALLHDAVPRKKRAQAKEATFAILPGAVQHAPLRDRAAYGNPIAFRSLRHEPVNEQGVVLLFAMLAKELGYLIEAVQNGFPDCEAMRQIGPGRWQRVRIEFEFESRNFRDHGHPANGCDAIVCWRHNWPECPEDIEVVELSSVIKSLADAED
jgi:Homing endonuclease associated repeat